MAKAKSRKSEEHKDALLDSMEGNYPDAFMFEEPGTMLVGRVKGFSKGFSKYGAHAVVLVQSEEDGEVVSVHCLHTALRAQMAEADPKPGDRIAVKYIGEAVAKSGKRQGETYKDFRVRVDSPTRTFTDIMQDVNARNADEDEDLPF